MSEGLRTLYKSQLEGRGYQITRSPEAKPFWEGCSAKQLMLPRCESCGRMHFYPRRFCPYCDSPKLTWVKASGRGTIYSFAIVRQPIEAAFASLVPYAIGIIDLKEDVRMLSRITGALERMACEKPVQVEFEEIAPAFVVPVFALVEGQ